MYDLEKKFFKLTLKTFEKSVQCDFIRFEKFRYLCILINKSKQLNEVDLFELVTDYTFLKAKI